MNITYLEKEMKRKERKVEKTDKIIGYRKSNHIGNVTKKANISHP